MNQYRRGLEYLAYAIANGLSGSAAQGIYNDLSGMRQQNMAAKRASVSSLMDMALGLSQQGYTADQITGIVGNYADAVPGLGPNMTSQLTDFTSGLPPAPTSTDPTTAVLDMQDFTQIDSELQLYADNKLSLHDARMRIMGNARKAGYSEQDLAFLFNYIGNKWEKLTGAIQASQNEYDRQMGEGPKPPESANSGGIDALSPPTRVPRFAPQWGWSL